MTTQLFIPRFRTEECLAEIRECLEKGWTGLGFKTVAIEKAWSDYAQVPHAHFLNSNTAGLHLSLEILKSNFGWQDHDEIITTPLTFVSTNHAILYARLKPVFADVDEYLCIDPESLESRITPRTRAVMFVGIGGNIGQYERVLELCRARKIKVILDAAHMAGTRWNGRHVGSEADVSVFSFQAVKNLPTADSGMICFSLKEDDERARKLSWLGINKDTFARTAERGSYKWMYDVEEVGYKYHGNSIMAAIALVQLKYLDADNAYRREIASWYRACFEGAGNVRVVPTAPGCESAQHLIQLRVRNRDAVMMALNEHDVFPGVHYRINTEYRMYSDGKGTCPVAERASEEIISLPIHLQLQRADIEMVSDLVRRYAA